MIASPPIETAVDTPRPAALRVDEISVVMPPLRDITPTRPGLYAFCASLAGPPMPPILPIPGRMIPRQFGPMIRAPRRFASSTKIGRASCRERGEDLVVGEGVIETT